MIVLERLSQDVRAAWRLLFRHLAFSLAAGLLLAMALVAGLVPARRAARVDPLVALRHE